MKMNFLVLCTLLTVVVMMTGASPHHDDDRYSPLIRLLKQLRRRDRYSGSNRDEDLGNKGTEQPILNTAGSSSDSVVTTDFLGQRPQSQSSSSSSSSQGQSTQFLGQRPQSQDNSNSNQFQLDSFSSPEQIQKIIRQSQQQGSSSGSSLSGGSSSLYQPSGTSVPPQRIEQINRGVSTILNGVGSGSLERILRGSFMFTRNENVKSVANNVLDSIFGKRSDATN